VKASDGTLRAASIAVPVTAAIAPPERMRETMVCSWFSSPSNNYAFSV
jgi:hypothetical protein